MFNLNLCGNSSALRKYEDEQAQEREPTNEAVEQELAALRQDRFFDALEYDTKDAFDSCAREWRAAANLPTVENVFTLSEAEQKHQLVILNQFKFAMEKAFRMAMYEIAVDRAREAMRDE